MKTIISLLIFLFITSCSYLVTQESNVEYKTQVTVKYIEALNLPHSTRKPASLTGRCKNFIRGILGSSKEARGHDLYEVAMKEGEELADGYDEIVGKKDMFGLWREVKGEADVVNQATLKYLDIPVDDNHAKRVASLEDAQRRKVYRAVDNHPVASQCHLRRYDPQGNMGFCFGRAMTAHLELLNSGVQKDKIRKLWAVGSFQTGSSNWRYHVTTIVKGSDGQWWAIDPIFGNPISAKDWLKRMKGYDVGGDMALFTTEAKRFGPSSPAKYSNRELKHFEYNNYFEDLLKSYRDHDGPFNGEVFTKPDVAWVGELFKDAIAKF
ncbi:MAG: hypothetical protein KC493_15050 [Bacteriovoracaceae bacterium]|nr:hypothetical protein [Bacteriovoracaceae bacterium]